MKIASRTRGETDVYRGPPCPNGHDGLRYKSTGQCVECKRESGRKTSKSRGSLSDAVRKQARWVNSFEKNFNAVSKLGILRVLSSEYHKTPLQAWVYRMRNRWSEHPAERCNAKLQSSCNPYPKPTNCDAARLLIISGIQAFACECVPQAWGWSDLKTGIGANSIASSNLFLFAI